MNVKKQKYKEALERLGFKQLDIYRLKERDTIRILRKSDGKVYLVDIPKRVEEMGLEEFTEQITSRVR